MLNTFGIYFTIDRLRGNKMTNGGIVQSAIFLLDRFIETKRPFDSLASSFFYEHKFIGSKDRKEIAKLAYDILRNFELLNYVCEKITENLSRFLLISYFIVIKKLDIKKVEAVFNGVKYSPDKLSPFERKFINKLQCVDLGQAKENVVLNYPEWAEARIKDRFKEKFTEEITALNSRAKVNLRVNTLVGNVDDVLNKMQKDGFPVEKTKYAKNGIILQHGNIPRNSEFFKNGIIEIQDEGSQLIAEFCKVKPGDTVVDFCAGAGGKTLALAAIMENKGRIYATDKYEYRLEDAKLRMRRAGVTNTYCNAVTSKWIKRHEKFADCVLVDAPCSGSGTWRRNPDMKIRIQENDVVELVQVQKDILDVAQKLVKPGGYLVYATCSIFKDENEAQILSFCEKYTEFEIDPIDFSTLSENKSFFVSSPYTHGMDGFFCARLRRS